jgi:hypothetical protein
VREKVLHLPPVRQALVRLSCSAWGALLTPRVIAYWENFSNHAFENTTQNFFQPTMLKAGGGGDDKASNTVQCSACYTIRRDVSVVLQCWGCAVTDTPGV